MFSLPGLFEMLLMVPAIVIGLTFHEFAHGWVADRLGDKTARYAGRLTLNPAAHIDPIGLIMLFIAHFGWAKPVPVNPYNLAGDIKRSMLLVSLAGPFTNFLVALAAAILLGLGAWRFPYGQVLFNQIITINVILAIFNLIPVPPLDGAKILAGILPGRQTWLYQMESYGIIILLLLLFTGVIGRILWPMVQVVVRFLMNFAYGVSVTI